MCEDSRVMPCPPNRPASPYVLQMPGTLVFDYPSVAAVTEYLTAQMLKSAAATASAGSTAVAATGSADQEWTGGELSDIAGSAVVAGDWAPRYRHLAVLAVVARPLMSEMAMQQVSWMLA